MPAGLWEGAVGEALQTISHEPWRSLSLFLFLLVGGETTLVPTMTIAVAGWVEPWRVIVLLALATVISDTAWYVLGWGVNRLPLRRVWGVRWILSHIDTHIAPMLQSHPAKIVFLSKFVFGARSSVQMLCGMYSISVWRYLAASLAGVVAWGLGVWFLLAVAAQWVSPSRGVRWFAAAVVIVVLLIVGLHVLAQRVWLRVTTRKERNTTSLSQTR